MPSLGMEKTDKASKALRLFHSLAMSYSDDSSSISSHDDDTFGAAEDQPLILADSASVVSETTSNSRGLPLNLKRQFVVDILARGGLERVSLAKLADEKPKTYGKPNSALRKQFGNLLQRWKGGNREHFDQLALNAPAPETPERHPRCNNR